MRLVDFIGPGSILPAMQATRADAAIEELSAHLATQLDDIDAATISQALLARESLGTTAIGDGVSVPHAKLAKIGKIAACLGRSRRGVAFGAADNGPVHFFVVVLSPSESAGAHLKLLARFSQVFRDSGFREKLMRAKSGEEMYQIIARQDTR